MTLNLHSCCAGNSRVNQNIDQLATALNGQLGVVIRLWPRPPGNYKVNLSYFTGGPKPCETAQKSEKRERRKVF